MTLPAQKNIDPAAWHRARLRVWVLCAAAAMTACGVLRSPMPPAEPLPPTGGSAHSTPQPSGGTIASPLPPAPPTAPSTATVRASNADSARAYRQDAAAHLYELNRHRIYKGKMQPLLYAIGVLDVDIDNQGRVGKLHWTRAPNQAPEVIAEIERTVRNAAPFPVARRLGKVTYTDVWLWDKSGKFQLDTLTEGQL